MGAAYRCTCSVERIEALREEQTRTKSRVGYDGYCRALDLGADCGPHVVRLKVPHEGTTDIDDLFKGPVSYDNREIDDLILVRTDGVPTYNFVVVVDDVDMRMTHVLRGEEHLNNTPKQVLIYKALGATPPRFGHMPLILGPDGSKLSKRHGSTSVASYREMGIHPEALVNYLCRLGWSHDNMEVFSIQEILDVFDLSDIGSSPGKWDIEKLLWVNASWMKRLDPAVVAERVRPFLVAAGADPGARDLLPVALAYRERARTLVELANAAAWVFVDDASVQKDEAAVAQFIAAANVPVFEGAISVGAAVAEWTESALEAAIVAWCEQNGVKLGKFAQPVRVAVSGQKIGPGLFQTLALLGRENSLRRLRAALDAARASA
jgi:glutamyl-tRNA synthetase